MKIAQIQADPDIRVRVREIAVLNFTALLYQAVSKISCFLFYPVSGSARLYCETGNFFLISSQQVEALFFFCSGHLVDHKC